MSARRFVLLDRDGTINIDKHYLRTPDQIELLPGAAEGLRQLSELGLGLVVVTNQSGVGRGFITVERLAELHARLETLLQAEGVSLDGIYFCPHDPEKENCTCRKPLTGMAEQAIRDHGFDPAQAFMIGDKGVDILLGQAIGATTVLVRTGYGAESERAGKVKADFVAPTLREAAQFIEKRIQDGA